MRPIHVLTGSLLLTTACPPDDELASSSTTGSSSTDDATTGSSTGQPTPTTGEPTTDDPASTTDDSATDDATTDDSTTGGPASDGARLLYFLDGAEPGHWTELRMVDDTSPDGPAAPVTLLTAPAGGYFSGRETADSGGLTALHGRDADNHEHLWLIDHATLAITEAILPADLTIVAEVDFSPDEQILGFRAGVSGGPLELYLCPRTPGGGCTAEVWSPPVAPDGSGLSIGGARFSDDGTRIAYAADLTGGDGVQLLLGSTDAPGEAIELAAFDPGFTDVSFKRFSPAGDILYFSVDLNVNAAYEYFAVDLASDPPGAPVQLSPPTDLQYRRGRPAPDMSALLWWTADDNLGDLAWLPLDGLEIGPATILNSDGPGHVAMQELTWSHDSQRVAYLSDHAQPGTLELYVVALGGPAPTQPVRISAPLGPGDGVSDVYFTADAQRILYLAAEPDAGDELFLADLASPGEAIKLSAPLGPAGTVYSAQFAPDESRVLYIASDDDPAVWELFLVDLTGAQPAPPVKLNPPLPPGEHVGSAHEFAPDHLRVYFHSPEVVDGESLFRVDTTDAPAPLRVSATGERVVDLIVLPPAP